jgi:Putative transposase of IS4/5 family (DUF4096)
MRYELTDVEWAAIKPFLPNKPRDVPRVNNRRVPNGIFRVLRSGVPPAINNLHGHRAFGGRNLCGAQAATTAVVKTAATIRLRPPRRQAISPS